jgi:sigma-54-specific transcriptional regulator
LPHDSQTPPRPRDKVVTFDNPRAYARTIRATALVFEDPLSQALQDRMQRICQSDATVLIIGETGTGKELVARQLHRLSPRRDHPFIAVNCAALSENLVESELFGHERGAFTGAIAQRKGWFEAANGGTLFLDEVGDLPPATQVKILRALQEREINRVGSRTPIAVDVRFVAATNVNLEEAVRSGRFREDLYYRLNVAKLPLPPLRDRRGDILPLTYYFLRLYQDRLGVESATISAQARAALLDYPWPGNIRELENVVHHALLVMRENVIQPRDLNLTGYKLASESQAEPAKGRQHPPAAPDAVPSALAGTLKAIFERGGDNVFASIDETVFRTAYAYCRENQVRTAGVLGISRNILRHRLKLYGLI